MCVPPLRNVGQSLVSLDQGSRSIQPSSSSQQVILHPVSWSRLVTGSDGAEGSRLKPVLAKNRLWLPNVVVPKKLMAPVMEREAMVLVQYVHVCKEVSYSYVYNKDRKKRCDGDNVWWGLRMWRRMTLDGKRKICTVNRLSSSAEPNLTVQPSDDDMATSAYESLHTYSVRW